VLSKTTHLILQKGNTLLLSSSNSNRLERTIGVYPVMILKKLSVVRALFTGYPPFSRLNFWWNDVTFWRLFLGLFIDFNLNQVVRDLLVFDAKSIRMRKKCEEDLHFLLATLSVLWASPWQLMLKCLPHLLGPVWLPPLCPGLFEGRGPKILKSLELFTNRELFRSGILSEDRTIFDVLAAENLHRV